MIHRINVHSDAVEHQIETGINDAKEHFKVELQKTLNIVKEENKKVFEMLENLSSKVPSS